MAEVVDDLGFTVKLSELQKAERAECARNVDVSGWLQAASSGQAPPPDKLKAMLRRGSAPSARVFAWTHASTAASKRSALASNYYSIMVTAGQSSPLRADIEQDAKATFPNHPWCSSEEGQGAIVRVLTAYAAHNDKVGYCRALNVITGMLLLAVGRSEETAFWLLASLVEDIIYPGTYSRNLSGCQIEMKALDELIAEKLPRLHAHMLQLECDISVVATDWYLCLFASSLPAETVVRVWDALFCEGPKIVFRVALALLKMHEEAILKQDNAGDVVILIRQAASSCHNRDKLMDVAFEGIGSLSMKTIEKLRKVGTEDVEAGVSNMAIGKGDIKKGYGKFMGGLTKWAEKTADKMAQAAERVGIKDEQGAPAK